MAAVNVDAAVKFVTSDYTTASVSVGLCDGYSACSTRPGTCSSYRSKQRPPELAVPDYAFNASDDEDSPHGSDSGNSCGSQDLGSDGSENGCGDDGDSSPRNENLELGDAAQVFDMSTPTGDKIRMNPGVEVFRLVTPTSEKGCETPLSNSDSPLAVHAAPGSVSAPSQSLETRVKSYDQKRVPCTLREVRRLHGHTVDDTANDAVGINDENTASDRSLPDGVDLSPDSAVDDITVVFSNVQDDDDCDRESWESSSNGSLDFLGDG